MANKNSPKKDAAYWEALLKKEGLSMGRGTSGKISFVGGSQELTNVESQLFKKLLGRKTVKKAG